MYPSETVFVLSQLLLGKERVNPVQLTICQFIHPSIHLSIHLSIHFLSLLYPFWGQELPSTVGQRRGTL